MQAFGGAAFSHGCVWRLGDFAAVALWLPPGIEPGGDANLALFQATVDSRKFNDLLGVFGQMEEAHPAMPHWYLPWFGVDCALQGQGLGSRLMTPCLDIVDRDHLPAYLDSTNPRNVPFYQRHGFEVTGQWQAGDSPRSPPCSGNPLAALTLRAGACRRRPPAGRWQARSWSHRPGSGFAEEYAELLGEQAEGGRLPGIAAHPNGTGSNLADRQRLLPGAYRVRKPWTVFTHIQGSSRALQRACLVWILT